MQLLGRKNMITGKIDEPVKVRDYSDQNFTPTTKRTLRLKLCVKNG